MASWCGWSRTTSYWSSGHTGGKFHVEIVAPDAYVKVAVPGRAMSRLARKTLTFAGP